MSREVESIRIAARAGIFVFALGLTSTPALGDCSPTHPGRTPNPAGSTFTIVAEGQVVAADSAAVADGVAMWERACRTGALTFRPDGNVRIRIRFHAGANDLEGCGNGCGCTIVNTLPAPDGGEYVASAIIHLFELYRDGGGDCAAHRAESIAHDVGHALGLKDLADPYGATCAGRIMSYTGYRSVEAEDCRALETVWRRGPAAEGREARSLGTRTPGTLKRALGCAPMKRRAAFARNETQSGRERPRKPRRTARLPGPAHRARSSLRSAISS